MLTRDDLKKFCSTDECRPNIQQPFLRDGYVWATNGQILVRISPIEDVLEYPTAPDVAGVFQKGFVETSMRRLRAENLPDVLDPIDCEDCDGRGSEHDCPSCNCRCEACDGTGMENPEKFTSVDICGALFSLRYIRLLSELPDVMIPEKPVASILAPMPFKFDGGDGLLMGLKEHYNKRLNIEV